MSLQEIEHTEYNTLKDKISFENTQQAFSKKNTKELRNMKFIFSCMGSENINRIITYLLPKMVSSKLPLIKWIIRRTIFKQFTAGETIESCIKTATKLGNAGINTCLDYAVEAQESEEQFELVTRKNIEIIEKVGKINSIKALSLKLTSICRFTLLEKLHQSQRIHSGIHANEMDNHEWQRVVGRLYSVCEVAYNNNMSVWIDAEETWIQYPIDKVVLELMDHFNRERAVVINTYQLYLKDRLDFLKISHRIAQEKGFILGAKLVRGAYMEKERLRAQAMQYESPIHINKKDCDADFDLAVQYCLSHLDNIHVVIASHNEKSNYIAHRTLVDNNINVQHEHVHFAQLYGMSDHISFNLSHAQCHVIKFIPFAPLEDMIPYMIRRAQENSSVNGQIGRELALIKKELTRRKESFSK
ncbi:MAG: proline dehydrogenase family protein [Phycisphaerales bacterium]|nr:proline dehydrogenase family protein [Phycisphaerales bacterium]